MNRANKNRHTMKRMRKKKKNDGNSIRTSTAMNTDKSWKKVSCACIGEITFRVSARVFVFENVWRLGHTENSWTLFYVFFSVPVLIPIVCVCVFRHVIERHLIPQNRNIEILCPNCTIWNQPNRWQREKEKKTERPHRRSASSHRARDKNRHH